MDLSWLQSILFGLVSGFTEILPVSARAHEMLLLWFFGADQQPLLQLFVKLGVLAGLLIACRGSMAKIRREQRLRRLPRKRRKRQPDFRILMDVKFLKVAAIPLLLLLFFRIKTREWDDSFTLVPVFLVLNGIFLFIPERISSGNKDSLTLSPLDGLLIGLFGGLSALPGISTLGMLTSAAAIRGTDRQHGLNLALLLYIPVMVLLLCFDMFAIVTTGLSGITFLVILQCILAAAAALFGTVSAVSVLRFLAVKVGFSGFAYYSWGIALFTFLMFLTT